MAEKYIPGYPGHEFPLGSNGEINRIVIHGTVSSTRKGAAVNTAKYFQEKASGGLAHFVIDPGEIVRCAPDDVATWGAPPNNGEIHIELCDWVDWLSALKNEPGKYRDQNAFNARWQDKDHQAMIKLCASKLAAICDKYSIPVQYQSAPGLLKGPQYGPGMIKCITSHYAVSQAWHQSDHSDPGSNFPYAQLLKLTAANVQLRGGK